MFVRQWCCIIGVRGGYDKFLFRSDFEITLGRSQSATKIFYNKQKKQKDYLPEHYLEAREEAPPPPAPLVGAVGHGDVAEADQLSGSDILKKTQIYLHRE